MTAQQTADVMLELDRERRAAERRGDTATAAARDKATARLAERLNA